MKSQFRKVAFTVAVVFLAFVSCNKETELELVEGIEQEGKRRLKSATTSSFNILTYNVAGLPDWIYQDNQAENTILISPGLNDYDIVLVQEDYNYHDALIDQVNHPYLSNHSGSVMYGDGLFRLSDYRFTLHYREEWDECHGLWTNDGGDCWTPKGFSFARHYLTDKVVIDIYNLHGDSGETPEDYEAREDNFNQLLSAINTRSRGQAVIVAGDMNSRWKDGSSGIRMLVEDGFQDSWAEIYNGGVVPGEGQSGGSIDKIMFRSSDEITLTITDHYNEQANFKDGNGDDLSDHDPRYSAFSYTAHEFPQISLLGAHNKYFAAEGGGGGAVNANRSSVGTWEKFILINHDSDPTTIKSGDIVYLRTKTGNYFTATSGGSLHANRVGEKSHESFTLINHTDASGDLESGDLISLKSTFNKYVVAESDGDAQANRSSMGGWEKFTVTIY